MAKNQKKPAKRVFFVRRNIDDVAAFHITTTDPQKLLDFYEGEFFGAAGADDAECNGRSRAFMLGWDAGKEQRQEAVEAFEKARDAGLKSAEAREAKIGTSRPNRGLGNSTKSRTKDRRGFSDSELDTEHPSDGSSDPGDNEHGDTDKESYADRSCEQDSEGCSEIQNQVQNSTQNHRTPTTHEPSSYDGGLKMTLSPNARARTNDEQNEYPTDPDETPRSAHLDTYRGGFPGSRKVSDLPPLKTRPDHFPGKKEAA